MKLGSKDFYIIVTNFFFSNKCCSFVHSINHRHLKKMFHGFLKNVKHHNRFQF